MQTLRLIHRFFHFESGALRRALAGAPLTEEFAQSLFTEPRFPRRELEIRPPRDYADALALHAEALAREDAAGMRALAEHSPEYPEAIRLHVPPERRPALLYVRGAPVPGESALVAVVGTRRPSDLGREAAVSFAAYLSALGLGIVSGLARGIDTLAHAENLAHGTVAVLGAGAGEVYPPENQGLAEEILRRGGTLLSPFPFDQVPLPQNFPDRNELIAALAAGVIVVEGAERSGAAITGRQALAMGKTVVVLAQDFRTEFGRGAIRLQHDGALFAAREEEAVEAIFRRFGGFGGPLPRPTGSRRRRSFTVEEFQMAAGCPLPEALALLEEGLMQGKIERTGHRYRRVQDVR